MPKLDMKARLLKSLEDTYDLLDIKCIQQELDLVGLEGKYLQVMLQAKIVIKKAKREKEAENDAIL